MTQRFVGEIANSLTDFVGVQLQPLAHRPKNGLAGPAAFHQASSTHEKSLLAQRLLRWPPVLRGFAPNGRLP